ncbi:MAG: Maf-like protein [Pseudomonadota bacterium]
MTIVLASTSPFRKAILDNAGLEFQAAKAEIDERAAEKPLLETGADAEDIASLLAEAKALDVSPRFPSAYVIGGDQTLSMEGELFHKVSDFDEARRRLIAMSGKAHQLNSALAIVRDGETLWRHISVVNVHMRSYSPVFVGQYLAQAGEAVLKSVGVYQVEGIGIQLIDRIEGDYFSVIGLPLLPLLDQLRKLGAIDG